MPNESTESKLGRPRDMKLRTQIFEAAFELERSKGYGSVTLSEIAERAQVGRQTIYRWWPTKPDLYLELMLERMNQSAGSVNVQDIDLEVYLRVIFKLIREEIGTMTVGLLMEGLNYPLIDTAIRETLSKRRDLFTRVITRFAGEQHKHFALPITIVVDMLLGAMWYRLLLETGPLDDVFAQELAMVAQGLLQV
jgi:AcrR family transcriptional regulator